MDLSAAASPVGVLSIATGSSISKNNFILSGAPLKIPSVLRESLLASAPSKILLVDSFQNAPFQADLSKIIVNSNIEKTKFSLSQILKPKLNDNRKNNNLAGDSLVVKYADSSVYGKIISTEGFTNSWHLGSDSNNSVGENLNFTGKIPTQSDGSIFGFSSGFYSNNLGMLTVGAWTSKNSKINSPSAINISSNVNTNLPAIQQGIALSQKWEISPSYKIDIGAAKGPTTSVAKSLSGDGAFSTGKNSVQVNWVGMHKAFNRTESGNYDISFIGQHSNIQSDNKDSLISLPKNIKLIDLMIGVNWSDPSEKSRLQVSFGKTTTLGSAQLRLKIPTSVNESGELSYMNSKAELNSIYDQKRASVKFGYDINKSTEFRVAMDILSEQKNNSMLGFGLNIKWN
jgi:hypothetical protein